MKHVPFVAIFLAASCALTAQAPSPTVSDLSIQQARERVRAIGKEISDAAASMPALPPKDQFESTSDYKKRNQAWFDLEEQRVQPLRVAQEQLKQQFYLDSSVKPVFSNYDADAEVVTVSFADGSCLFNIPKTAAKEIHDSWSRVTFAKNLIEGEVQKVGQQRTASQPPATQPAIALVWGDHLYLGSGGSSAPMVLSKVDPGYSGVNGAIMLSLVVNEDGRPGNIKVVKSLGKDSDDEAIKTVQQWRFKPARNNCVPVKVTTTIEMNFRKL